MNASEESKYDPAIREELDKANWQDISLELIWYARSKMNMLLAMGITDVGYEDLIQEAISLAYGIGPDNTYRNWNREVYSDLAGFLRSVIKSIVSHKIAHHLRYISEFSSIDDESFGDRNLVALSPKNPEEIIKQQDDLSNLKEAIYERFKGDEEIGMALLCLEDGISKPRHIAEETGYDINKVNNALRKLRRYINELAPTT